MNATIYVVDFGFGKGIEVEVDKEKDEIFKKLLFKKEQKALGNGARYIMDSATLEKAMKHAGSLEKVLKVIEKHLAAEGYSVCVRNVEI